MIEGGWPHVWAAYALALIALGALSVVTALRLAHWSRQARAVERKP
jgi:hypothetical protein